ncbi:MAG TPA: class I SAM-dependent methyltransferase [Solirubrobacteraceae bacterium]|nr:class I SAM-dependent methyltransferase [Solirubrobacteraceae bacterium]
MPGEAEQLLAPLLQRGARRALHDAGGGVLSVLEEGADSPGSAGASRFEGVYGPVYDRVIQSDLLRRLAPLAYGPAGPVPDLDGFARRVARETVAEGDAPPWLLDVPCGGGTLLPRLREQGFAGVVIESDLGAAMLRRAAQLRDRLADGSTVLLRADAQDLPLRDASVDGAVSLNGLHCMPDPRAFVDELGRVVRPGGRLFLVTLVRGGTRRADLSILAGRVTGIIPTPPPPRETLLRLLRGAGWQDIQHLGGKGLLGYAATRRA